MIKIAISALLTGAVLLGSSADVFAYEKPVTVSYGGLGIKNIEDALIPVHLSSLLTSKNVLSFDDVRSRVTVSGGSFVNLKRSWKVGAKTSVTSSSKVSSSTIQKQQSSSSSPNIANQVKITAHNGLERHLATKMMNVDGTISLSAFPQTKDFETLLDALEKVMYQNPLILGVDSFEYDSLTNKLHVYYSDDVQTTKTKQVETLTAAKKLKASIIKQGMTQGQKEFAIYNYLDKHTKYDNEASISAEDNLFTSVDAKYNDSFSTYGIIVKKTGVCMSYTGAFKLLADLAGLDTIVVTGKLSGTPHTWMKVKLDSAWYNVDPTNNATNIGMPYVLYNATDKQATKLGYVQDKSFWTDKNIPFYASKSGDKDYYVLNKLEVSSLYQYRAKLTDAIAKGKKKLIVRDLVGLNKNSIQNIVSSVLDSELKNKTWSADLTELGNYIGIEVMY